MSFADFGLAPALLKALAAEGYDTPTPIQTRAIPPVMAGKDLCGIAQTGTGKTAAFALPILNHLVAEHRPRLRKGCRVLVLSPTRELASQIADSFRAYGRYLSLTVAVVFGGTPIGKQQRILAPGVDVLVATPGRLLDLCDNGHLTLRGTEVLVLDEADQMLDLGFIHALKRIVGLVPHQRQTLLFSATMPSAIETLAAGYLRDPVRVAVAPVATTVERVEQKVMHVPQAGKQGLLGLLLRDPAVERVLVFTRTKHGADRVVKGLDRAGIQSAAIHGNKSQAQRERALAGFRTGACKVLIATDIAARGIDVAGVTHVINFDLPHVAEQYVHRIGRTARAGATGTAITLCAGEERGLLTSIERLTRQRLKVESVPAGFEAPVSAPAALARTHDSARHPEPARHPEKSRSHEAPRQYRRPGNGAGRRPAAASRTARPRPAEARA